MVVVNPFMWTMVPLHDWYVELVNSCIQSYFNDADSMLFCSGFGEHFLQIIRVFHSNPVQIFTLSFWSKIILCDFDYQS